MEMRHKVGWVLVPLVVVMTGALASCAAGPNAQVGVPDGGDVAGFWLGLWHGFIAPITFLVSLFTDNVSVYEVHNNGNWYDFGFVLGAGILFGGGGFGSKRWRH
jgi:hypothetical protein